jgi:hypothetical protein
LKEIVIEVSNDGEIRLETKGFEGKACLEESQYLKDLLGSEICRSLTPAYYTYGNKKLKKYLNLCG